MEQKRIECIVSGRVQGVGFRSFVKKSAKELGIKGFTKNLSNGKVKVIAEGSKDALNQLIDRLNKGPILGKVNNVKTKWTNSLNEFDAFEIKF